MCNMVFNFCYFFLVTTAKGVIFAKFLLQNLKSCA